MKRSFGLLLALALYSAGQAYCETPSLETVKSSLDEAWKKVNSFTCDITAKILMPVGREPVESTGTGQLNYLRDGGKDKYRQQIVSRVAEPFSVELKLDVLYDGDTVYTTAEFMGQKKSYKGKPSVEQNALPPGGSRLVKALEEQMAITVLPNETLGGHEVFVLEGTYKNPAVPLAKARFYLDRELGIQRKTEIYQGDGTVAISFLFENVQLNSQPDPALFTPEG